RGSGRRPAVLAAAGSGVGAGVEGPPLPEQRPREDAGGVTVVPGEGDAPSADELGVLGAEGEGRCGLGPDGEPALAQPATFGARAVDAELLERILGRHALGPGRGESLGPVEVERGRRWRRLVEGLGGRALVV